MTHLITIPGYEILEKIYDSSRSLVYRGCRVADQKRVVIKLPKNEYPTFSELVQFRHQYLLTQNLEIPGIISPLALENYHNSYALVMEDYGCICLKDYVNNPPKNMSQTHTNLTQKSKGNSLQKKVKKDPKVSTPPESHYGVNNWVLPSPALSSHLTLSNFLKIALQLAAILEKLYHYRIIHKDIKPHNILIQPETQQVFLIDFSLASWHPKEQQENLPPNHFEGTLAYMSPEQTGRMNRGIDYRTDLYSLGVTFYELLTGKLPFQYHDPIELVHCLMTTQPIPPIQFNAAIPQAINDIIMKLMEKSPENRYQSASGLRHDLEICLQQWQHSQKITSFVLGSGDQLAERVPMADNILEPSSSTHPLLLLKHWQEPVNDTLKLLQDAYSLSLENGDLRYAAYCGTMHCLYAFFFGKELTQLEQEITVYEAAIRQYQQQAVLNYHQIHHQLVLNLLDQSVDPCRLVGTVYDEIKQMPQHQKANDLMAVYYVYSSQAFLCYLFQDYPNSVQYFTQAEPYVEKVTTLINRPFFYYYDSLARLAIYHQASPLDQKSILKKVLQNQAILQDFAHYNSFHFTHKFNLVEAELYRVLEQRLEAMEAYDQAIAAAQTHQYIHEAALANELAARFYLNLGKEKIAKTYLLDAYYGYSHWGAKAKIKQLETQYSQLLAPIFQPEKNPINPFSHILSETLSSSSGGNTSVLDLATVMKAAQALSGEICLEELLLTLLQVMIENAGAEKCSLLLLKNEQLVIEAQAYISHSNHKILCLSSFRKSIPISTHQELPISLIQEVENTKQTIILNDFINEIKNLTHILPAVLSDPYLQTHPPKSVLCTPIQSQGKFIGILYLENNLITGAFTPARLEILQLLCSQAAISLENARLYEAQEEYSRTLEQKVMERTQELQQEITERKLLEEKFSTSEGKMRALLEAMTDIVLILDAEASNIEVAPTSATRLYNPENDLIGKTIEQFFIEEVPEIWLGKIRQAIETQQTLNFDYSLLVNEQEIWFSASISPLLDNSVIWVSRNITARKQAEEALRLSEEKFSKAFRSSPNPITITSLDGGRHLEVNESFLSTTGFTREEVIGRTALELNVWVNLEDRVKLFQILNAYGVIHNYEFESRAKSGEIRTALLSAEIITLHGQKCLLSISNDITERKRTEEALRQSEANLKQALEVADAASKAKSEFLSKMSHELRTPLNAILGFTQVLARDASLNSTQKEQLAIIGRSGEHLLSLINDVLEMSKIEAGRLTLNETNFDLYRLLDTIEEMLRLKAESKGLQLIFDPDPELPQYIRTDESKLRQVLINLISNAIKFSEEGGVAVRAGIKPAVEMSGNVLECTPNQTLSLLFEVEDTGVGISEEEIDRLFDPFVQTEAGQKSQEGTGLGLPISRQFVQLMGGDLVVSSRVAKGSIFKFEIQGSLATISDLQTPQRTRRVIGLESGQPTYRILVVEDRWESRLLLVNLLTSLGFEVQEATNGQEAIEIWERWEPHLIWMDMRMPIMDGYEATKRIKAHLKGQATVIIALTASALEENRITVLSAGCDDFMRKPFREDVLFEKMAEYLGVRYVYEEELLPPTIPPVESLPREFTSGDLAAMATEWIAALHHAAINADSKLIFKLVDQLPDNLALLAQSISIWVNDFRFDKITDLTEPIINE